MKALIPTCLFVTASLHALSAGPAESLPRSEPEAEGVSASGIHQFVSALDREFDGIHSVMVLRHGKVIAEGWWAPYAAGSNHVLYSLSKSFTSTAVGFAVAEGKLDISDPVLKFFPKEAPEDAGEFLKAMRVRDLLTMSTGHGSEPPTAPDLMSAATFFRQPITRRPGTQFGYNTAATFMQSAIVQKVTGDTVVRYLKPRLFEPLGIKNPVWDTNFEGISLGGYGLRVTTEDIAKLGQLYLQKGKWDGQQLLPETWVEQATSKQIENGKNPDSDWNQGYGFQFWRCRHNAFRGDGAFGQYCVVMPDQEMVIAITSGIANMQAVLNLIWDNVLPAIKESALDADAGSVRMLREKLVALELPLAEGEATSEFAGDILDRKFLFPENELGVESVELKSEDGGKALILAMQWDGQVTRVPCGFGKWVKCRVPFEGGRLASFKDEPVAGSFAWESDNTCVIREIAYETPFSLTLRLKFEGETVTLDGETNVAFGPTKRPQLLGRAEPAK